MNDTTNHTIKLRLRLFLNIALAKVEVELKHKGLTESPRPSGRSLLFRKRYIAPRSRVPSPSAPTLECFDRFESFYNVEPAS